MSREPGRRAFLAVVGGLGLTPIAGCAGLSYRDPDKTPLPTDSPTPTPTESPTPTETDTLTETEPDTPTPTPDPENPDDWKVGTDEWFDALYWKNVEEAVDGKQLEQIMEEVHIPEDIRGTDREILYLKEETNRARTIQDDPLVDSRLPYLVREAGKRKLGLGRDEFLSYELPAVGASNNRVTLISMIDRREQKPQILIDLPGLSTSIDFDTGANEPENSSFFDPEKDHIWTYPDFDISYGKAKNENYEKTDFEKLNWRLIESYVSMVNLSSVADTQEERETILRMPLGKEEGEYLHDMYMNPTHDKVDFVEEIAEEMAEQFITYEGDAYALHPQIDFDTKEITWEELESNDYYKALRDGYDYEF